MNLILRPKAMQVLMCLAVLGLVVYANAVFHPFVHDDVAFIRDNPNIARWDNITEVFFKPGIPLKSLRVTTPYYRPLLEVFYRFEYLLFGMNPAGYHFFNIALHIINSFLAYLVLLAWRMRRRWAFFLAVLFLVHPLQTEAVACIAGVSNLAVAFFILLSVVCYERARNQKARGLESLFFAGAILFFVAALFTKEQAVLLPLFLAFYEILRRRIVVFRDLWLLSFLGVAAGFLIWRAYLFPNFLSSAMSDPGELRLRLLSIPQTILMDWGLVVYPVGLHYYRTVNILDFKPVLFSLFIVISAGAGFLLLKMPQKHRVLGCLGLGWAFVMALTSLNIAPLIVEYSYVLSAEHFLYLPLLGALVFLLLLMRFVLKPAWKDLSPLVKVVVMGGIFLLLATATVRQNTYWRGEIPLFERALGYEPQLGRVQALLSKAYTLDGRYDEALVSSARALRIMENYVKKTSFSRAKPAQSVYVHFVKAIHFDRAQIYVLKGDERHADDEFRAVLALRGEAVQEQESKIINSRSLSALGLSALRAGKSMEAKRYWQMSVVIDTTSADALSNLGALALERNDKRLAVLFFQRALKASSDFHPAVLGLRRIK
ncbi:MAG: hypothetical protein HQL16_06605 [Candidatus Omnitrophica bacterium]|nr:hypothetical protein [Candidatus Omnitrophota bacterium]